MIMMHCNLIIASKFDYRSIIIFWIINEKRNSFMINQPLFFELVQIIFLLVRIIISWSWWPNTYVTAEIWSERLFVIFPSNSRDLEEWLLEYSLPLIFLVLEHKSFICLLTRKVDFLHQMISAFVHSDIIGSLRVDIIDFICFESGREVWVVWLINVAVLLLAFVRYQPNGSLCGRNEQWIWFILFFIFLIFVFYICMYWMLAPHTFSIKINVEKLSCLWWLNSLSSIRIGDQ